MDIKYGESENTLLNSINNIKNMLAKNPDNILTTYEKSERTEPLQDFIDEFSEEGEVI